MAETVSIDDGKGFCMQTMRILRCLFDTYKRDEFSWGKRWLDYPHNHSDMLITGLILQLLGKEQSTYNYLVIHIQKGLRRSRYDLHRVCVYFVF